MTPPDTNIEKQTRQHRWPLIGMALVVLVAGAVIIYWLGDEIQDAPAPATATTEEIGPGAPGAVSPAQPANPTPAN